MSQVNPQSPAPAALFAALGDSTRLMLVERLGRGEHKSIAGLSAGMKLSRQGVSKHLESSESAGIIESERVGREIRFSLQPDALSPLQEYLELVSSQWDEALSRLQSHVEAP